MSSATEMRGTTFFAEAAGRNGKLRCSVVCRRLSYAGRAHFAILLRNESINAAQASAIFPEAVDPRTSTLMQTSIAPDSIFTTTITLELTPGGGIPEIHIALGNGDVHLLSVVCDRSESDSVALATPPSDALENVPAGDTRVATVTAIRPVASPAIIPMVGVFAALIALIGGLAALPRITSLDVPPRAGAQNIVTVGYRTLGLGGVDYALLRSDGASLAAGTLPAGSGSFALRLPPAPVAQSYRVRVHVAGPLGTAAAEGVVDVAATLPPVAARATRRKPTSAGDLRPLIRSLDVDRAMLVGGQTLNVSYAVRATSGTLALIDPATQIVYEKTTLNSSGHAAFTMPRTDAPRFLSVVITAEQHHASTQSRIGVTVTPPLALPSPSDDGTLASRADDDAPAAPTVEIIAPATVRARGALHVGVRGASSGMQLVVLDSNGHELARREVQAGNDSAQFTAPDTHVRTRLVVELAYPNGDSSEANVRSIAVIP